MKATVKTLTGTAKGDVTFPKQFDEEIRPDLIKRAVLAIRSHKAQVYGAKPDAGRRQKGKLSRRRRDWKAAYGHGISRVPRKIMSHRGTRFNWVGAVAPNTVGGRRAHPPQIDKVVSQKINIKEKRKAIRSALSASVQKELVAKRGHVIAEYPLVVDAGTEGLSKTKEVLDLLSKLGLDKELERVSEKKVGAGKAKMRGRRKVSKIGPVIIVSEKCKLMGAAKNIPGVQVCLAKNVNAELLAPGGVCGRLAIFTDKALEKFSEGLFLEKTAEAAVEKPKRKSVKKEL